MASTPKGVEIYTTIKASNGLASTTLVSNGLASTSTLVLYLLLAIAWLKIYLAEPTLAVILGLTENTGHKWT